MISINSIPFMHQTSAASEGLNGNAWNFSVTLRPMLANPRKERAVRPDEIVIG